LHSFHSNLSPISGVKIIEDCHVKEILTEKQRAGQYDRVTSAVTSQGNIKCDVFINCTGMVSEFHWKKRSHFISVIF
jgi:glycine/D-amino acid oxidase-like deaminating enzyme